MTEQKIERNPASEPKTEWTLHARRPVAITELTGGIPIQRAVITSQLKTFDELAKAKLAVFSVQGTNGETQYAMMGPGLTAKKVNSLLYFGAPYKEFGLDRGDIVMDWNDLYAKAYNSGLLASHRTMPGWSQFEESRERLLGLFTRENEKGENPDDVVYPLLRWKKDVDGNRTILLDPPPDDLRVAFANATGRDAHLIDSSMGLMYLTAYSPEQSDWEPRDGYSQATSDHTQPIGPTQVLAYAYREVAKAQVKDAVTHDSVNLQKSPILSALDTYIDEGEIETIAVKRRKGSLRNSARKTAKLIVGALAKGAGGLAPAEASLPQGEITIYQANEGK